MHLADAIGRLPDAAQQRLARLGLIDAASLADPSHQILPMWTVKETWYWDQIFPAGRDLNVEHRYRPGVGGTAGVPLATLDYRNGEDGRRAQAEYCTDAAFLAALDRMTRRAERDRASYPMEQRYPLHPHHRRQLARADRRFPAGGRQGQPERDRQLLRRGRAPDLPDPVRGAPPQLAAGPRPRRS